MSEARGRASAIPRILLPFLLITLIWSSTWIVIKGQLGIVPPVWSVSYRFLIAGAAMLVARPADAARASASAAAAMCSRCCSAPSSSSLNYSFVYASELYITSGLAAVVFALLVAPNAALAWLFFGRARQRPLRARLGGRAWPASPCCSSRRCGSPRRATGDVLRGLGFVLCAVLAASVANVMQLMPAMKARPIAAMLGWAMLYGAAADAAVRAGRSSARRCSSLRPAYWLGLLYLEPRRLGARLLALLPDHPRGRAGQGGLFERADPDRRDGDLDRSSKIIAGRRWRSPAACSSSPG